MKPRPWLLIPPPRVARLPDGRYWAWSVAFSDLRAVGRSADAASFVLRLLIQKRLYGQSWRWQSGEQAGDQADEHGLLGVQAT